MKKILAFLVLIVVIGGVLVAAHMTRLPHGRFLVDFLDVGQGDAILLTAPSGEQVLIDGGPEQMVLQKLAKVMPFLDRTLDLVVLTHPHADHVMGLVQVLERYEVGAVLLTGVFYENPIYEAFLEKINKYGVPILIASGQNFMIGEVDFRVLFPLESLTGQIFENINNSSIVLKATHGDMDILLTGDAEHEVEEFLLFRGQDLEAEILKIGHHGSRTASSSDFLDAVSPEIAIIQSGEGNDFKHPHEETLENLKMRDVLIRRNDLEETIRFICSRDSCE